MSDRAVKHSSCRAKLATARRGAARDRENFPIAPGDFPPPLQAWRVNASHDRHMRRARRLLRVPRVTPRVLVVDDKLAMAETLADGLVDHGLDAIACGSGRAALAALVAGGIAVVVTDLRMPDVDGFTLLDHVRAAHPGVQVIVMTAYGAIDAELEAARRGAFHYLTKPFKLDELVGLIRRALAIQADRRPGAAG
jgi:CheY-like chemotaxis protein